MTIKEFLNSPTLTEKEAQSWDTFKTILKAITLVSIGAYGLDNLTTIQQVIEAYSQSNEVIEAYQYIERVK